LQGAFSSDQSITAWGNLRISDKLVTKTQAQIDPKQSQTMVQLDNEYTGDDFSMSLKALSPSLMEGGLTGIVIGSYLQSVTPKLSVGLEGVWQRAALGSRPETAVSYCARYRGTDWIASAQLLAAGSLGASYWRRLTEKVEAGVDCQLQFAPGMGGGMFGGPRRDGTTTVGVKYNFATSVYRAQVDSAGKIGVVLERRVAPPVTLTFAAEIDQMKVRDHDAYLCKACMLIMNSRTLTSLALLCQSKEHQKNSRRLLNDRIPQTRLRSPFNSQSVLDRLRSLP
jgi:mitochondrial import receptor subunit TOM40